MTGEEPAMRFCVLASGSKGNAIWLEAGGRAILIDCGLTGKELRRRLTLAGLESDRLQAIIVSHEHRDHIQGVGVLARALHLPVYLNAATLKQVQGLLAKVETRQLQTGADLNIGFITIQTFAISHDSAEPMGFVFIHDGIKQLGLATDLGVATGLVRQRLSGCRALILEANHDPEMLMNGPYPWDLKQRVRSRHGHLSNFDSAELLAAINHSRLEHVVLAHLSETNNHPDLALETIRSAFAAFSPRFTITTAAQECPGPLLELT
ncbi:MAG: MBL fold metallo-hydrolase [Deltaproteobacteria bacterium]|nr:MBL fold metallo-hydrolase [Deltaproteobacteria bacterium]